MLTEKEFQLLSEFQKNGIPFLIVGMSAAVLQDVPLTTKDVDLWFKNLEDPNLSKIVERCGGIFVPANMTFQMPPLLGGDEFQNLDVVYGISGLNSFDEEYANAIEVDLKGLKVKILPLDRIIASKESTGREKDKAVLPILKSVVLTKINTK